MAERPKYGINPRLEGIAPLDFAAMFGNDDPVVVEIGSGKGRFLIEAARENRRVNYVGIEKSLHYYRVIEDRLRRANLVNARIVNFDASIVLEKMVGDRSVDEIHIYFPDPWPRPRERKRRMIRDEVMEQFVRVLKDGGGGVYVTDHAEYFAKAVPVLQRYFEVEAGKPEGPPRTNYEAKYRAEGREIYEARFRKRRDEVTLRSHVADVAT
jgi:tRNA (guanine-N7-)-methyltransferase